MSAFQGVCVVFLLVIALLSALLMQRVSKMGSWSGLRRAGYTRLLVVALLFDSWLFAFASAVVLFGVDSGLNDIACAVGIWWCIFLYATSKILIYGRSSRIAHVTVANSIDVSQCSCVS